MEERSGFWDRPRPNPEQDKARAFVTEFQRLLEHFEMLEKTGNSSKGDWDRAYESASLLIHESVWEDPPYRLQVTIPEGIYAETSIDMVVIEENVRSFDAAEFRGFAYVEKDGSYRFRALFSKVKGAPLGSLQCSVFGHEMTLGAKFPDQPDPGPGQE